MNNPTPRDSAQLPPADFIADLTKSWEGPWANAADTIVQALRAQAASGVDVLNEQREQFAELMEAQHAWISNTAASKLIREFAPPAHIPADVEAWPMLDDEGKAMIVNSHHYTVADIRCTVERLQRLADPMQSSDEFNNMDWRGFCNVLWRLMLGLAADLPPAPQPQPVAATSPATAVDAVGDLTKAAKRALEALESLVHNKPYEGRYSDAILHLRAALQASSQPQAQQAVAEGGSNGGGAE